MVEMTQRERFMTAIRGGELDRVPFSPRIAYFLMEYYGEWFTWELFLRGAKEFGYDSYVILNSPLQNIPYLPHLEDYSILGDEVRVEMKKEQEGTNTRITRTFYTPNGVLRDVTLHPKPNTGYGIAPNPHREEYLFKGPEDLDRIPYLLPDPRKVDMAEFHQCSKAIGQNGVVAVTVNSAIDHKAGNTMSVEKLMTLYYDDKPLFKKFLDLFHRHSLEETKVYLERGVEIIFGTWFFASIGAGWSPKIYQEIFAPMLKEHVEITHRYGGIYHLYDDGACMPLIEIWRDCGVDIISTLTPPPMGDVDLRVVKEKVGTDCCLRGYVDHMNVVTFGTPQLIDEKVREAISIAAPGGKFILGTSDSIRDGTPPANIHAYCQAALKYGKYPIKV